MSNLKKRERAGQMRVPVQISPAHVHLNPAAIEELFCDRYHLHEHVRAGQPAQYVAREAVTLIGPEGELHDVAVIGPPRGENQVEVSRTEGLRLGIEPPLRGSGDLQETPGISVQGPRARVHLRGGVIRALCHVHMRPIEAERLGVKDRDRIEAVSESNRRRILFRDVLVRVSDNCRLELHLDADEGASSGLHTGDFVILRKPRARRGARTAH